MAERTSTPPSGSTYHRPEQPERGKVLPHPAGAHAPGSRPQRRMPQVPRHVPAPSGGPSLLRGRNYPMGGVFIVGALLGTLVWLYISNMNSPEKVIPSMGEMRHVPACSARIPEDSPGADAFRQGQAAYEAEDWDGAVRMFDRAAGLDPGLLRARHFQGIALLAQDRPEEAVEAFDAAIRGAWDRGMQPDDASFYYIAKAHCRTGNGQKAAEALAQCVAEGGNMAEACVKFMNALSQQLLMQGPSPRT